MYLLTMLLLVAAVVALDFVCRTRLLGSWKFWTMQLFTAVMVIVFDLYANGRIWFFTTEATIGLDVLRTPVENLLFGFVLISATLILFEKSSPVN